MSQFPRTQLGGVAVSRLVAGSNWFLGFAHQTKARTNWIVENQNAKKIGKILEVFLRAGVNVAMGTSEMLSEGVKIAQQRVGAKMHLIGTPNFKLTPRGPDWDDAARELDRCVKLGSTFCWPHQQVTDNCYDGFTGKIRGMERIGKMTRQRGMIPGLSTHNPACIIAADRQKLDVASYISIFNSAGFLMQVEIDWTLNVIHNAAKPVTTIKPMAAGRVMPYVAMPFVWSVLRDIDLVTVGTTTPEEAKELIEMSLAALEKRQANRELQFTRSKASLLKKP
jgi:hypothetical protein